MLCSRMLFSNSSPFSRVAPRFPSCLSPQAHSSDSSPSLAPCFNVQRELQPHRGKSGTTTTYEKPGRGEWSRLCHPKTGGGPKPFRITLLYKNTKKLPSNHTLAKKTGGGDADSSRLTSAFYRGLQSAATGPASLTTLAYAQAFCENPAMPSDTDLQLRPAAESDTPLVLDFIRKLAEYGDISSETTVTEADVRAALFGPRPVAEAILAYVGDEAAGFAVFS